MKHDVFIDTSGFYALLVKRDTMHATARGILQQASSNLTHFITTDYVIDEIATLLQVKGCGHLLPGFFDMLNETEACTIQWMDQERFSRVQSAFLKHSDHVWSFTDCFSFAVMKELRLTEALTKDKHFREAGFKVLLE